jgi:hypothetical protein
MLRSIFTALAVVAGSLTHASAQDEATPYVRGVYQIRCNQDYGSQFIIVRIDFDTMTGVNVTRNAPLESVRYANPPIYGAARILASGVAGGEDYVLAFVVHIDSDGVPSPRGGSLETPYTRAYPQPPYGERVWPMTCNMYYG